jgi:hypothetical protein
MWKYKKQYENVKVHVRGYGVLDTSKVSADVAHKYSQLEQYSLMSRLIEKNETKASSKGESK